MKITNTFRYELHEFFPPVKKRLSNDLFEWKKPQIKEQITINLSDPSVKEIYYSYNLGFLISNFNNIPHYFGGSASCAKSFF